MKKLITIIFCVSMYFVFTACSSDYPGSGISYPSYRDGKYEGKNLVITLNGEIVPSVTKVIIKSDLIDTNPNPDASEGNIELNPIYYSEVMVYGFPGESGPLTFYTISDLSGFKGNTRVGKSVYEYEGEFIGDPLVIHDQQGLILHFSKVNYYSE